jgi:hypothetical protein
MGWEQGYPRHPIDYHRQLPPPQRAQPEGVKGNAPSSNKILSAYIPSNLPEPVVTGHLGKDFWDSLIG